MELGLGFLGAALKSVVVMYGVLMGAIIIWGDK